MAFLNLRKNKKDSLEESKVSRKLSVAPVARDLAAVSSTFSHLGAGTIIISPRVTEKATFLSGKGNEVHVFLVSRTATKRTVAEAIHALYKVSPAKVAILKVPPKKSFVRGRVSLGKTGRKAYVYLKKGDKIEIM